MDALNSAAKNQFLSTPSARRATALDELTTGRKGNFYPRPPRGGRLNVLDPKKHKKQFLSTPSARRATPGANIADPLG